MNKKSRIQLMKSAIPKIKWPALPSAEGAHLLSILFQIESSQWQSGEEQLAMQRLQLAKVLEHAVATVPYYRDTLRNIQNRNLQDFTWEEWRQLPILTRSAIQEAGQRLVSKAIPVGHGSHCTVQTSGSTGTPITSYGTAVSQLFWLVIGLRDHLWHHRDFSAKHAIIRYVKELKSGETLQAALWGQSTAPLYKTGPAVTMSIMTDVETQARWLMQQAPNYLLSYPTNILALARVFQKNNWKLPSLLEIRTIGESFGADVREICKEVWGVAIKDVYSSQEIGYIALQCPEHEHYHIQSETVLVEVLDDNNIPCQAGQIGRIVVSSLHNFAMPFIRYELGDYAEVGAPCPCGRGLPVLTRILGRHRNMMITPNSRQYWPSFPASIWAHIGGIRQIQFIQVDSERLTVNLVADRELLSEEKTRLIESLHTHLPYHFQITLCYMDRIERSPSGKYEDFISRVQ
jgi:phenylacetate-CoA ligase